MNLTPQTDPVRRALRVAMVMLPVLAGGIPALAEAFDVPAGRVAQITAVFSFVVVVLTAVRNHLEDNTTMPALLKSPPSGGENPVPDPAPEPDPIPSRPVRKPRKRVARDDGQSLVYVLIVVLIIVLILRLL